MNDYFHARWYIDGDGLLQRRDPIGQQRAEEMLLGRRETAELSASADRDACAPAAALDPSGAAEGAGR